MASCGLHYMQDKYITLNMQAERRWVEMDGPIGQDGWTLGETACPSAEKEPAGGSWQDMSDTNKGKRCERGWREGKHFGEEIEGSEIHGLRVVLGEVPGCVCVCFPHYTPSSSCELQFP